MSRISEVIFLRAAHICYLCGMFSRKQSHQPVRDRWLDIEETRLVSDLRIMHAKVDELYNSVKKLRERFDEPDIVKYADEKVLQENIKRVDELYLWFLTIKEQIHGSGKRRA